MTGSTLRPQRPDPRHQPDRPPVNARNSTGVKITRARATTFSDPDASLNGTAAITTWPLFAHRGHQQ